jgi:CRP/FNR family transcriptional regulator, cyclic AMP receptor protein
MGANRLRPGYEPEPLTESLLELAATQPTRTLAAGEVLIAQGREAGDLFVLESGQLVVERDGVAIATISSPNSA